MFIVQLRRRHLAGWRLCEICDSYEKAKLAVDGRRASESYFRSTVEYRIVHKYADWKVMPPKVRRAAVDQEGC